MATVEAVKPSDEVPKVETPLPPPPAMKEEVKLAEAEKEAAPVDSKPEEACADVRTPKDRDVALAKVNTEKKLAQIKAWEENKKSNSLNKYQCEISKIDAWENAKKASAEAKLKKSEEALENKKAAYVERMKNEIAAIHKLAEEKRAAAEAKKGETLVETEEKAAKYRASGDIPKKMMCFGG